MDWCFALINNKLAVSFLRENIWYTVAMEPNITAIKEKIVPILKEAGITKSALFGSYVHGEETEKSDIDLLVEYPQGTNLFDVVDLQIKLENVLGKSVDLVSYKTIKPRLRKYILSEQVPIL